MSEPAAESTWPTATASGHDPDPLPLASPLEAAAQGLGVGLRFGRYTLVELLGHGGMGVVFAARDEELDREVAIKFVTRGGSDPAAHAQLLAEAQALARLSHPNVIHVYEVGEAAGRVFLAMERVRGGTLRAWLAAPRTWPEVLVRFIDAGRGLAAAHQAGLIHCDFKPDNVLVGDDGRLRVVDFGLARRQADARAPTGAASPRAGTPGYMAPEHHAGLPLDGRSDQFSFCVALYEGLVGHHPFAGAAPTERLARLLRGEIQGAPAEAKLPARLRRALRRGLAPSPADRHPSMEALLVELTAALPRPRGRWWAAAFASAALTSTAWLLFLRADDPAAACAAEAEAAAAALWGPEPRAAAERAFAATRLPYAADTFARVARLLDLRVDAWSALHRQTCAAPPDDPLARCVARHRRELAAWIGALAQATPTTVEEAVTATAGLADPRACLDPGARALADDDDRGADDAPITRAPARLGARLGQRLLDEAHARELAGHPFDALAPALAALAQARAAALVPLEARAHLRLGLLHEHTGDGPRAEGDLAAAFFAAEAAGLAGLRAEAAVHLVHVTGAPPRPPEVDALWSRLAEAAAQGLGEGALDLRASLLQHRARAAQAHDPAAARADLEAALDLETRRLGQGHPSLAELHQLLGEALAAEGRLDEALAAASRALDLAEATLGQDHPAAARRRLARALARERRGDPAGALDDVLRVLVVWERAYGEHPRLIWPLTCAGRLLRKAARPADAAPHYARALAIAEATHGPAHPEVARALIEAADLDRALGRPGAAQDALLRALAILRAADGAPAPALPAVDPITWLDLGDALLAVGAAASAGEAFDRAHHHPHADADARAAAAFGLARALWDDPAARARALDLAAQARAATPADDPRAAAIDAWLGPRRVSPL